MARIKGVDIPNEKRIEVSLTYIYGIGRQLAKTILSDANVDLNKKAKDLTDEELATMSYATFEELLIHTEWRNYPDQTARLERKAEAVAKAEKKRTTSKKKKPAEE